MPENPDIFHYLYLLTFAFIGLVVFPLSIKGFLGQLNSPQEGGSGEEGGEIQKIPLSHINFADVMFILLICGLSVYGYFQKDASISHEVTSVLLISNFIMQLGFIVIVTLIWCFRVNIIEAFGLKRMRWMHVLIIVGMLVIVWGSSFAYIAWLEFKGIEVNQQDSITFLQTTEDYTALALFALVAVIGAPFSEEVLYRGYIYPTFKRFVGLVPALLFSGLFFAVIHNNLFSLPVLFLFGVLLALSYELTRTLWVPILGHLIFNGVTVFFQIMIKVQGVPITET